MASNNLSKTLHSTEINTWKPNQPTNDQISNSQSIISDIADALHLVPATVDNDYLNKVTRAASYLGNPSVEADSDRNKVAQLQATARPAIGIYTYQNVRAPVAGSPGDSETYGVIRNGAMAARNNVFDVVNQVNAFIARANNAGFAPPENPFTVIATLNSNRAGLTPLNIEQTKADELVLNIGKFIDLLKAEREGKLNLNQNVNYAAQLSSPHVSFDGLGGSGNAAIDLMQFLPDMDLLKEQRAAKALEALDFSKRVPRIIFTSDYAPDGIVKGGIIGWNKMNDASGYIIKRKNILDNHEVSYAISNEELNVRYSHIKDYVKAWILTFYDNVDENNVVAYLDGDVEPNSYYTYNIQAYQIRKQTKGTIFNVETTPFKVIDKNKIIQQFAAEGGNDGTISPYPLLAQIILGDAQYDWVLAGVNVRASINRNDSRTDTRKYSYITAQLPFILDQMDREKFVFPKNVGDIVQNVSDSISEFGVTQTIQEILQETGILYYFDGKDPKENTYFTKVNVADSNSDFLSTIVAAVDPETFTLDLSTLATNLPKLLAGGTLNAKDNLDTTKVNRRNVGPTEIVVPDDSQDPNNQSTDEVQLLRNLDINEHSKADLTTFDGLSKFIRTIRIFSDVGPHRGAPITAQPVTTKADPIPQPPPPKPAPPAITPSSVVTVPPPAPAAPARTATAVAPTVFNRPKPQAFVANPVTRQLAVPQRYFIF